MTVDEVLDHPWIVGGDKEIMGLRRKSNEANDDVLKFVAYSNTGIGAVMQHSPKQATKQLISLSKVTGEAGGSKGMS